MCPRLLLDFSLAGVGTATAYANVVQSNLTVSVGSVFSFDGAGICVQPGN